MLEFFFLVVGANVRNNPPMSRAKVMSDYRRARDEGHVLLLNEVGRDSYRAMLRLVLGIRFKIVGLWRSETPVAFRKAKWKMLARHIYKMHEGKAGASPIRRLVIVILEHLRTGGVIAFVCSHRVSGAWNNKPKRFKRWRQKHWLEHDEAEKAYLLELYNNGITWVRFADFNKLSVEKVHPDEKWILGKHNIVKMSYLNAPGGVELSVEDAEMILKVNTDHPMGKARMKGRLD